MPRVLTDEHKAKLAQGRADAAELELAQQDAQARDWLDWMRHESAAYSALSQARAWGSDTEIAAAYTEWREWTSIAPNLPTSAAMKRVRGDLD